MVVTLVYEPVCLGASTSDFDGNKSLNLVSLKSGILNLVRFGSGPLISPFLIASFFLPSYVTFWFISLRNSLTFFGIIR